jgi:hypothetical protein
MQKTILQNLSGNRQTRLLVRECAPQKHDSNRQIVTNILSRGEGARQQD